MILVYKNNENTIELRHTLHKVINKEYKICDSSMQFDRNNNLILNLTLDIPNKESKDYVEGRTLGVDLGIKYPAYVCLSDDTYKRKSIGCAEDFIKVRDSLMEKFGEPKEASLKWVAKDPVVIDDFEKAEKIQKLLEALEDNDDAQNVYSNFETTEEIAEKL